MEKSVFVTVGTTSFDDLIEAISSKEATLALLKKGYGSLLMQYGRGKEVDLNEKLSLPIKVDAYKYKSSIHEDIINADLIISHAGAGSCLEVLGAGKKLLVVVNEKLMDNHQFELARKLHHDKHLLYCTCSTLVETITNLDLSSLQPLPEPKTELWADDITAHFGLSYAKR